MQTFHSTHPIIREDRAQHWISRLEIQGKPCVTRLSPASINTLGNFALGASEGSVKEVSFAFEPLIGRLISVYSLTADNMDKALDDSILLTVAGLNAVGQNPEGFGVPFGHIASLETLDQDNNLRKSENAINPKVAQFVWDSAVRDYQALETELRENNALAYVSDQIGPLGPHDN